VARNCEYNIPNNEAKPYQGLVRFLREELIPDGQEFGAKFSQLVEVRAQFN
jgi:hypothetical protein